ncbi:hypothetical protein ACH5RR_003220 [Cinchona calisaya]|uniref:Uncharacterized protein n=1 Tax=Cinchona calisaya TaxID=153742 RepID=A0ABD3AUB3_9GENT
MTSTGIDISVMVCSSPVSYSHARIRGVLRTRIIEPDEYVYKPCDRSLSLFDLFFNMSMLDTLRLLLQPGSLQLEAIEDCGVGAWEISWT